MIVITKLNSIESKISEALINNDEGFMTGNYQEKNYRELTESIWMKVIQKKLI